MTRWPTEALGSLAELNPKRDLLAADDCVSFLGLADVRNDGTTARGVERRYSEVAKGYTPFRDKDLLVAKITPSFENGKISQASLGSAQGYGSTEFHVVRPGPKLDGRYALRVLRHERVRESGSQSMVGSSGHRRVPESFLAKLQVPLPPLDEQRRIAAVLDHVDALRAKRRESVAVIDSAAQSLLTEAAALGTTAVPFRDLVEEFRYGTSEKSGDSGLPTLRIPNVLGGRIDVNEIKTVPVGSKVRDRLALRSGDMLFVRTNGNPDNVGRSAVFDPSIMKAAGFHAEAAIFASYLIRARLRSGVVPDYVQAFFSSPAGRRRLRSNAKTSAGQYNINIEGIGSTVVDLPDVGRQKEFQAKLGRIGETRVAVERHLSDLDLLFASLQSRAFSGDLDVSKVALPSS